MKKSFLILVVLFVFVSTTLYADNGSGEKVSEGGLDIEYVDSKKEKASDEENVIIVSADRIKRNRRDITLSSSVVDSKKIEENQYTSLSDLLESTPGFSRIYDYHSPMILRGSAGSKMLILRNGNPCFSSMPGGFMGQSVNVYDIERTEVIRGPGSVIYGSGATCGIINIIEKDIFEEDGFSAKLGGSYGTNSNSRMGIGQAGWNNGLFAIQMSGRYRKSDNMHYADDEESLNSFHEDRDFSLRTGVKFNDKNKVVLSTSLRFGGPWGKPYMFNKKEQMIVENRDDNLYHFAGRYEGNKIAFFENLQCSIFYDFETRDYHKKKMNSTLSKTNFDEVVNYENKVYGGNFLASVDLGINSLSFGGDGYVRKLWSPQKTIDYYNQPYAVETDVKDGAQGAGTSSVGAFFQDRMSIRKDFTIIAGARFDRAEVFEGDNPSTGGERKEKRSAVSGNAGIVYNVTGFSSLAFNAGRAFRMPDASDMFTERATCSGVLAANPDLEPEYSWNFDIGYRGSYKGFEWDVAVFSNIYEDLIIKVKDPDDSTQDIKDNSAKARIMGGEISLAWKIRNIISKGMSLKPGAAVAYYRGDSFTDSGNQWNLFSSGEALTGIPPVNIRAFVRYEYMSDDFNYFFEIENDTSLEKARVPDELAESPWNNEDIPAYGLVNIMTGISLFDTLGLSEIKLNIKVLNLLDHRYYPFGSHIPGRGRDFKFFLSTSI